MNNIHVCIGFCLCNRCETREDNNRTVVFLEFESGMASKKSNHAGFGPAQRYKALWDYKRRKNDELSFAKGEILVATLASEAYWLVATNRQGQCGLIPENYVRPVKIKPKKEEKQQIHSNSAVGTAGGTAGSAAVSAAVTAAKDSNKPPSNKPPSKEDSNELLSKTPSILQIEDWEQRVASIMVRVLHRVSPFLVLLCFGFFVQVMEEHVFINLHVRLSPCQFITPCPIPRKKIRSPRIPRQLPVAASPTNELYTQNIAPKGRGAISSMAIAVAVVPEVPEVLLLRNPGSCPATFHA